MKSAFAVALIAVSAQALSSTSSPYRGVAKHGAAGSYAKVSYKPVTKVVQPAGQKNAASAGYAKEKEQTNSSDWDAWGRDQDLAIDESYGRTRAKSYKAESYDEWDNSDNDAWGAQAWGRDRDLSVASSSDKDASLSSANGQKLLVTQADWAANAA